MNGPFAFLRAEWPAVYDAASRAAAAAYPDPRTACFYARRALELAVAWVYKSDASLRLPYQDNLSALIHEPSFKAAAGEAVFSKARLIKTLGNQAVHSHRPIQQLDALTAVRELFHVGFWLARTYARGAKPNPELAFDASALPRAAPIPKQTIDQLRRLEAELRERDEKLSALLADKSALDEELKRLRAEVAEAKRASAAQPDKHNYNEAETRDRYIDLLLREAGWPLDKPRRYRISLSRACRTTKALASLITCCGARMANRCGAGRGQAHPQGRPPRGPAAGQALRRLPGGALRPAAGDLLFQWLRALDLGRHALPAARRSVASTSRDELELLIQRRTGRKKLG